MARANLGRMLATLVGVLTCGAAASAETPPTFTFTTMPPVRIEVADRVLRKRAPAKHATSLRRNAAFATITSGCASSPTLPKEIVALAAGLKCNPDLIFEYVYNNIEYEPLFGSNKGAFGTLLDQRGSDADQAQLFTALLSASGYTSAQFGYVYGYIRLTGAQAVGWLGIKNDATAIASVLAQGGIPIANVVANGDGTLNRIDVAHIWVTAQIGGTSYVFDPSYKQHNVATGVSNLATILGYSQSQFLADAGGTIDSVSITGVNRAALRADLVKYASNLVTYVRANNPAASVNDIVGGKVIAPLTGSPLRQTTLPTLSPSQPSGFPQSWGASVPNAYRTCFTVSMPGVTQTPCASASSQTILLYADQTYGHRITIFSVPSGGNYVPTLLIDGAAPPNGQNTGTAASSGTWAVNVAITHPYTAPPANQSMAMTVGVGGSYLLNAGWGTVGRGMVEKHRTLLAEARAAGNSGSSEIVLGETLAVIGYSWLAEGASYNRLSDSISAITTQYHHGVGITAQTAIQGQGGTVGPYVDLPLNYLTLTPQTTYTGSGLPPSVVGAFFGESGVASSLESAVLEQTQALVSGMTAASTVRIVDLNAGAGAKTYFADATTSTGLSTYFSTIRPNLVSSYSASQLASIDASVSTNGTSTGSPTGNQLLLPINGMLSVGLWKGAGFTISKSSCAGSSCSLSITQRISGGLSGGFSGSNVPTLAAVGLPTVSLGAVTQIEPPAASPVISAAVLAQPYSFNNYLSNEPVDTVTGAYLYNHSDLTVGSGSTLYSLGFERNYSSASQSVDIGFGNGWTSGFSIAASINSDPFAGFGDRGFTGTSLSSSSPYAASGESSAIAAASAIAATYIAQDLLKGTLSAQTETLAWLVQGWQTDQLTNNAVLVSWPNTSEEFVQLPRPDGAGIVSYSAPPGSAVQLTATGPDGAGNYAIVYQNKDQSRLTFNGVNNNPASGKVASWTMPFGMSLSFGYDGSGNLTSVSNGLGRSLTLSYSGTHLSSVTDGNGRSVQYGYDGSGNAISFTDPLGNTTSYRYDKSGTYDTAGHLTQIIYPSTPTIPFVTNWYDPLGRVNKQANSYQNATNFYISGARSEIVDPGGDREVTYQTARGSQLKDVWVLGGSGTVFNDTPQTNGTYNVSSKQYDGQDRLALAIAPEGGTTAYTYSTDLNQNVVQIKQTPKPGSLLSPLITTFAYDPTYNKPTIVIDPRGLVTQNIYDPATGNLLTTIADVGSGAHFNATSRFSYDSHGLPLTATDPLGVVAQYSYDSLGNRLSVTADAGSIPAHLNLVTRFGYDAVGNVISTTDPKGAVAMSIYDASRQMLTAVSPAASQIVTTTYKYDPDGRVLSVVPSVNGASLPGVSSTYTLTGKLATTTDANGNVTRYAYDSVDRLQATTDPLGWVTSTTYDAMSRPTGTYNLAIQAGALVTRSYTPDGLLASLADAAHPATAYAYDGLDRLATTTYPGSTTETYTYDADSNVLTRKTRKGDTITFTYDTLNRVASKAPPSPAPAVSYAYDQAGHLTGVSDAGSSVVPVVGGASYAVSYSYDALNRPLSATWTPAAAQTLPAQSSASFTHRYDADNRRIGQTASDNSWLKYATGTSSISYTANALNQYSAVGAVTPMYDNNGSLSFDGTLTYAYDAENRLTSVKQGATTLGSYAFDAQGRRKAKTVGATTTVFVTDADNREVLEYDGATGAVQRWYGYGPGANDALNQMNVAAGTRTTLIPDIQGSFVATLDSSGSLTKAGYLPYGENPSITSGTYRYVGSRIDPESGGTASQPSGLYYMRARMYSPTWGRFLQADPLGYAGGINLYEYANGDPVNFTDPYGTQACAAVGAKVGVYCIEARNAVPSLVNIRPAPGLNTAVVSVIHTIDEGYDPEHSYVIRAIPSVIGTIAQINVASGTAKNTADTVGLKLNAYDYIGAAAEAHDHPFKVAQRDEGPEDSKAAYQLNIPVYTSHPDAVTVSGMVNGQLYTQYLQGTPENRSQVQSQLNDIQRQINLGKIDQSPILVHKK